MQFWDLKMSKMAVADCSGVGDVVMPKHSTFHGWYFTPSLSKETRTPAQHSIDVNQSHHNALIKWGPLRDDLMSALGQKQTCAAQKVMSALPPKADICDAKTNVGCQ